MAMKTIIGLWHYAKTGKTEVIRNVAKLFMQEYKDAKIEIIENDDWRESESGDFTVVIHTNNKKIGISSAGDPGSNSKTRLTKLATKYLCDIIICASRSSGETVDAVSNVSSDYGYQLIWLSTYQTYDESLYKKLNDLNARHIFDLLNEMKLL